MHPPRDLLRIGWRYYSARERRILFVGCSPIPFALSFVACHLIFGPERLLLAVTIASITAGVIGLTCALVCYRAALGILRSYTPTDITIRR